MKNLIVAMFLLAGCATAPAAKTEAPADPPKRMRSAPVRAPRKAARKTTLGPMAERLKGNNAAYRREIRTDYDTIPGKVIHWYNDGSSKTNDPFYVDLVVCSNAVEKGYAKWDKAAKAAEKARKHDAKNVEKAVKELEKLKEKSSEYVAPLYDAAIEVFVGK